MRILKEARLKEMLVLADLLVDKGLKLLDFASVPTVRTEDDQQLYDERVAPNLWKRNEHSFQNFLLSDYGSDDMYKPMYKTLDKEIPRIFAKMIEQLSQQEFIFFSGLPGLVKTWNKFKEALSLDDSGKIHLLQRILFIPGKFTQYDRASAEEKLGLCPMLPGWVESVSRTITDTIKKFHTMLEELDSLMQDMKDRDSRRAAKIEQPLTEFKRGIEYCLIQLEQYVQPRLTEMQTHAKSIQQFATLNEKFARFK